MPIVIRCQCGQAYRVKKQLAGKVVKCKVCESRIGVPQIAEDEINDSKSELPSPQLTTRQKKNTSNSNSIKKDRSEGVGKNDTTYHELVVYLVGSVVTSLCALPIAAIFLGNDCWGVLRTTLGTPWIMLISFAINYGLMVGCGFMGIQLMSNYGLIVLFLFGWNVLLAYALMLLMMYALAAIFGFFSMGYYFFYSLALAPIGIRPQRSPKMVFNLLGQALTFRLNQDDVDETVSTRNYETQCSECKAVVPTTKERKHFYQECSACGVNFKVVKVRVVRS